MLLCEPPGIFSLMSYIYHSRHTLYLSFKIASSHHNTYTQPIAETKKMITTHGKIESLKKIRETLKAHGLNEFNSIGEINTFLLNYDSEVKRIREDSEQEVTFEHAQLEAEKNKAEQRQDQLKELAFNDVENKTAALQQYIADRETLKSTNSFQTVVNRLALLVLRFRQRRIEVASQKSFEITAANLQLDFDRISSRLYNYTTNKSGLVKARMGPKLRNIEYTKTVLEELNPLIAGAVGESKVETELKNLSVHGVLLNDFYVKFYPPIYNRKEKDKIFSIQVDHLLITRAGIFILETKNWSKSSIERFDLRSPVDQIKRFSYALFVLINSVNNKTLGVKSHHWGEKEIPIQNVIVMIGHKPNEEFKYVKVKTLHELNGYIEHFESILTDEEVNNVADYLRDKQGDRPSIAIQKRTPVYNATPSVRTNVKSSGGSIKTGFAFLAFLIIIIASIGAIYFYSSEPFNIPSKNEVVVPGYNFNNFIVKETCLTYSKPDNKSAVSGHLASGREILVENPNQFKYFYQIPDENGKTRYVRKEYLTKK